MKYYTRRVPGIAIGTETANYNPFATAFSMPAMDDGYMLVQQPPWQLEELRCEYCNRIHARGQEVCNGCGAVL
jgi:hypothetical protein